MLAFVSSSIKQLYSDRPAFLCLCIAVIVLMLDYVTGKSIEFPIAYALPTGLAAWRNKKHLAYALAIFLPLARVGFHFLWNVQQPFLSVLINAPITILALAFYAYFIDRVSWQKRALEKEVKALEGILPICASCKKIRNEHGEYEQMEKYVTEHSEASFSHGICPECAKKLYPDIYNDSKNIR